MAIEVDIVANETGIESALNKISTRLKRLEVESKAVSNNVSNIGVKSINSQQVSQELRALRTDLSKTNKEISSAVNGLNNSISGLVQGIAVALTGGALTAGFVAATAKFTDLENRIALVTGRTDELITVQQELVNISAKTFSSVDTSVESFNRFGQALKSTRVDTETLLTVTENVQKAIAISGGSAQSASAAIFQLGQGLSAGALRGQELNSVMEQAPRLATALADELGVSMGGLRAAAEEGKLTADVVTKAFINQGEVIDEEFQNISPTITKASLVFADAATQYIGQLDKGLGLSKGIANQVLSISKTINAASVDLDVRVAKKMEELNLGEKLRVVLLVGGGILNVFSAIINRIGDALPSVILPTITLFDQLAIAIAKIPSITSLVDLTKEANAARTSIINLAAGGGTLASNFKKVFESSNPEELRVNLDNLAWSIDNIGKRWFNVDNAIITVFRRTNLYLLTTGRYLGILDQSIVSLRFDTFEDFGFILRTIVAILKELILNLFATRAIKDFFKSLVTAVSYLQVVENILLGTFKNIGAVAKSYLTRTTDTIIDFAEKVKQVFYDLYIYLVGNSVWPDTILEIEEWTSRLLDNVLPLVESFSSKVKDAFSRVKEGFKSLPSSLSQLQFSLDFDLNINIASAIESVLLFLRFVQREVLTSLGNAIVNIWAYLAKNAPVLADIFGAAVVVGIVELLGVSLFALVKALFTGALVANVVSRIISESGNILLSEGFFTNLGKNLGYLVGQIFYAIISNVPFLLNALLDVASGFAQGFIKELSFVGSAIANVLGFFTPLPVAILELALFGSTVAILMGKVGMVTTFVNTALTLLTGKSFGDVGGKEGILKYLLLGRGRVLIGGLIAISAILGSIPTLFSDIVGSVQSFITLGGLASIFLFGPGASTTFILKSIDSITNYLIKKLNIASSTGFKLDLAGMLDNLKSGGGEGGIKNKLTWYYELITDSFSNENAREFLAEQFGTDLASALNTLQGVGTKMRAAWLATVTFMSNAWTGFALRASLVLGLIQARWTAFVAYLNTSSFLAGKFGMIGRVLFGVAGIAVIIAMFSGAANAAEDSVSGIVNSAMSYLQYGLLAAVLLGSARNPTFALKVFANTITMAFNLVVKLGAALVALTKGLGFASTAVVGSAPAVALRAKLAQIGGIVLGWAIALGNRVLTIIPAAFSAAFTAAGMSTAVLAASLGFLIPALIGVTAAVFIFGDGIGEFFADLIFKMTGIGSKARKVKQEIQDILTVDKVGEIDVVLKSKLDEINFSVLSERDLASLKKELTNSNNVFERNQAIFQEEGDLTRLQIKETNRAIDTSNTLLDKLSRRGEKGFAGGLLNLFNDNLEGGFENLREGTLELIANSASFDETSAKRLVTPIFNRLDEVLSNPNAAQEDVSQALMGFKNLISMPEMSSLLESNPELQRVYESISRQQTILERMQVGSDTVATAAELAFLQMAEEKRFQNDSEQRATRLESRINNMLGVDELYRLFSRNQDALSALIAEASNKGLATGGLTPIEIAEELGINSGVALLEFMKRNNITEGTGNDTRVLFGYLADRDALLAGAVEEAMKASTILARESITGGAVGVTEQNKLDINELESLFKSLTTFKPATDMQMPEINWSNLTTNQYNALSDVATKFEKDRTAFFTQIFTRLAKDQSNNPDELKVIFDEKGNLRPEELDRFLAMVDTGKILLSNEEQESLNQFLEKFQTDAADIIKRIEGSFGEILNEQLSSSGLDFKLEFIDENQHALLKSMLNEIDSWQTKYNDSFSARDFLGLKSSQLEATLLFANIEDKLKVLSDFGVNMPSIDEVLALDQKTIDRILAAARAIALLNLSIESFGQVATAKQINPRVADVANSAQIIAARQAELQAAILAPFESPSITDTSKDSGGGAAKTWWEGFKEGLSSMDLSLGDDFLSAINKQTVDSLVAASSKYKAAQEAINKSAADEVSIRQKNLKIMQEIRRQAVSSLANGTFGGASAMLENIGQSVDKNTLGLMNATDIAMAKSAALRIEQLTQEREFMAEGSQAQISATLEINRLTDSLEKLTNRAQEVTEATNAVKDSFRDQFKSFLKGETTLKGVFEGVLDTFTNTVIDKFSQAFTNNLFEALGLDKIFDDLFSMIFSSLQSASMKASTGGNFMSGILSFLGGGGGSTPFFLGGKAEGGYISGPGSGTSDSILARLSNGEYVMNAATTKRWLPFLESINSNDGRLPAFASGGLVGPSNPGAFKTMNENSNKDKQQQVFNINVTGDVSTQTRKEIARMIPEITSGVNMTNRERGSR
jgi:tape measure domain-containing protein